jgi:hypothetical protein
MRFGRAAGVLVATALAGCGLDVQSPDLFLITRVGQRQKLTMLVNDGGTIRCNGGPTKPLPDRLLLQARDLANSLDSDAKAKLHVAPTAHSVVSYTVKLQNGTLTFPDTAAATHEELAQAELFTIQAARQGCGLGG